MSLDVYLISNICTHCNREDEVYSANITHNLNKMAAAAGIYEYLWRPEEVGATKAKQLIGPLSTGLDNLLSDPNTYTDKFSPPNGWGTYDQLVKFVKDYVLACERHPDAEIRVSR